MQRATLAIRAADTYGRLRDAGAELASAMQAIGLPKVPGFLRAAQKQILADTSDDDLTIQRVAARPPEEEREEEENGEKRLAPHIPFGLPRAPMGEELPGGVVREPRIGGAAVLREDRERNAATSDARTPTRGQQAERYYGTSLGDDHPSQRSYIAGKEVRWGAPGSVRPDFVSPDGKTASFEVKSYDLTTNSPSRLVRDIARQAIQRANDLPQGMTQKIAIDITGQTVTLERQDMIRAGIVRRSLGLISADDIGFFKMEVTQ